MNKLRLLSLVFAFIAVASLITVGVTTITPTSSKWEKFSTFFKETKANTSAYNVEAAGWNVRVIEWIPNDNPNYRCMFIAGTEKAGSSCYPAT